MAHLLARIKPAVLALSIQAHATAADQGQVQPPTAHQVGQLPVGMEKLLGHRRKRHETRPLPLRVEAEKTTQPRLRHHPFQMPIAVKIRQCLARGLDGIGEGDAWQGLPWTIDQRIAAGRAGGPERLAVIPAFIGAVQDARQTVAVQVHQLIMLPVVDARHGVERLVARGVQRRHEGAVGQFQRRPGTGVPLGVKGLVVHGVQATADGVAMGVLQQQTPRQHRLGAQARLVGEVMKHQHLLAPPQGAEFKAIGITADRVVADRPSVLFGIGRHLAQACLALTIIQQQFEVPLLVSKGVRAPQRQMLKGLEVAVAHPRQITLGAIVPGGAWRLVVVFVVVIDLLTQGVEAFLQQPLGNT